MAAEKVQDVAEVETRIEAKIAEGLAAIASGKTQIDMHETRIQQDRVAANENRVNVLQWEASVATLQTHLDDIRGVDPKAAVE